MPEPLSLVYSYAPTDTETRTATMTRSVRDVDMAFFDLFQQLSGVMATDAVLPTLEPADSPEATDETEATEAATPTEKPLAKAATATANTTDKNEPLTLSQPLSDQDAAFLEWMIKQANQPPMVTPTGLVLPAWIAQPFQPLTAAANSDGLSHSGNGADLSETFSSLVKQAAKTGRSIRVPLQNQVEVILKIRQGQVSAEFLTPEFSPTLQQTVAELRQHLASKQLPVQDILYRDRSQKQPGQGTPQEQPSSRQSSSAPELLN